MVNHTTASELQGLGRIPTSKPACLAWLNRYGLSPILEGNRYLFLVSDLPEPERRAYLARCAENSGLPVGEFDSAAHETFWQSPPSMRAEAERKAAIACYLVSIRDTASWPDRLALVQEKFGSKGTSKPSLKRLLSAVKGVDPINYAPSLLAGYKSVSGKAEVTDDAWRTFMTIIRDAGPDFPLSQAWRDVRDIAASRGWDWPTYMTVTRRWNALSDAQRMAARFGHKDTAKSLAQPHYRDKTTISALEWVSLDGRTLDFWTDMGDGRPIRLTMLALVDVASNMVLGYELAASENAVDTVRLIRRVCTRHGVFDRLYTDNGSAFAGHLVAGGNAHRFRNAKNASDIQPVGVCYHLGIKIHFALPGNAQAKIAERTFASLSRVIDDRPEFANAHAGHAPGAAPHSRIVPVSFEAAQAVIEREVARHNAETGRRSQGARGRSYAQVFEASAAERVKRVATERQLYLASLIYTERAVNKHGQIMADNWVYGGPETQEALLPYHGSGKRILLGRNPDDLSADAIAFNADGRLISEGIRAIKPGAYGSKDGIRDAARNRKAARDAAARADELNNYLSDTELADALAALTANAGQTSRPDPAPTRVIGGRFGSPLRSVAARQCDEPNVDRTAAVIQAAKPTAEMMENFERSIGLVPERSKGGR